MDWPNTVQMTDESMAAATAADPKRPWDCTICVPTTQLNSKLANKKHKEGGKHLPLCCHSHKFQASSVTSFTAHVRANKGCETGTTLH